MRVPKAELPDVDIIRERALWNLPIHYRLKSVRCEYGSMALPGVSDDFQVVIEYRTSRKSPTKAVATTLKLTSPGPSR